MRVRRALSSVVRLYLQHAPTERGTYFLKRMTAPWLVARLPTGPWIRVSGVSCFEWVVFDGGHKMRGAVDSATHHIGR